MAMPQVWGKRVGLDGANHTLSVAKVKEEPRSVTVVSRVAVLWLVQHVWALRFHLALASVLRVNVSL